MNDDFIVSELDVKQKEYTEIIAEDRARASRNYWLNKRMKEEQERRERARQNQFDNEWKEYTSTGEEWENEDW